MSELVPVHGGLPVLVSHIIPLSRRKQFLKETSELPSIVVKSPDVALVHRICDGTLSPLWGLMTEEVWHRVLEQEYIEYNFQKYAWTIPIALPLTEEEASHISWGKSAALKNEQGHVFGIIKNAQVYTWDKAKYIKSVYGTERSDHPGGSAVALDPRTLLVGGDIWALPQDVDPTFSEFVFSPRQTRLFIEEQKWERALAFQTRSPLNMAHEFAIVKGLETLTQKNCFAGVILNPLIGKFDGDEVPAKIRMQGYHKLLEQRLIGQGGKNDQLWKSKGYDLFEVFALIGLDMKIFHGGPKEAVMHAIYRQNHGFTDLMVGSNHANANFQDGTSIWGNFDAYSIFDNLKGDLKIKPCPIGDIGYFENNESIDLIEKYPDEKSEPIDSEYFHHIFSKEEIPDPLLMRPEVSQILCNYYREQRASQKAVESKNN